MSALKSGTYIDVKYRVVVLVPREPTLKISSTIHQLVFDLGSLMSISV